MSILKFLKTLKLKGNISPLKSSSYYSEFKSYLASNEISNEALDLLFEWYTLISVEQYCKDYPSPPSKLCYFGGNGKESIFITCEQCCTFLENYCICNPHEHLENHKLILYKSAGAICDCGNVSIMKSSGFCYNHCDSDCANSNNTTNNTTQMKSGCDDVIENKTVTFSLSSSTTSTISNGQIGNGGGGNSSPVVLSNSTSSCGGVVPISSSANSKTTIMVNDNLYELRLFFRHLFRYLADIVTENLSETTIVAKDNGELIAKIETISQWIVSLLTQSSMLLNLVSEELLGHAIDTGLTMDQHYRLTHAPLQPIILDVVSPTKRSKKSLQSNSNIVEAQNNIDIFIKHNYSIHYLYPFLIHLICNHKPFKYIFLRYFLPIYNDYYHLSFGKSACNGISILSVAYIGEDSLINYVSVDNDPINNLISIIFKQTIRMCKEILENVYLTKNQVEYWFRSDLYILKTIFKIDTVIKHIMSESGQFILDGMFESAASIQALKCVDSLPYVETLGFVKELEANHQSFINALLDDRSDLIANRSISSAISKYISNRTRSSIETPTITTTTTTTTTTSSSTCNSSSTVTPQQFCIVSLLSSIDIYKKDSSNSGMSELVQVSLLDIMIDLWRETTATLDQEQRPLLQQIFLAMIEVDEQFKSYFNSCNVIIETPEEIKKKLDEQKKSVSDKRKKLLQQMRQQQMCFLQQETAGDSMTTTGSPSPSTISIGSPMTPELPSPVAIQQVNHSPISQRHVVSTSESTTSISGLQENNSNNNNNESLESSDDLVCIVCNQCSSIDEPLHVIGLIERSPVMPHHQKQEYERLMQDVSLTVEYRKAYKEVRGRLIQDIQTALQSNESADLIRSMLPMAFPYVYPTYVKSCHHYIHQSCLTKLHESYANGFNCPLCSNQANVIIPLPQTNNNNKHNTLLQLHQSLATFDIKSMKTPVTDKYIWKFLSQNIELLEIKTRTSTLYNEPNEDPYFILTEKEFERELFTLYLLFNSIMSNSNQFTTSHDIQQTNSKLIRTMDPFTSHTFMVYLLYHYHHHNDGNLDGQIQDDLKATVESFYNQIILHYIYKEKQYTNIISTLADIKRSPHMFPNLLENNNNQLPFFRKLYLFTFLFNQWKLDNPQFGQFPPISKSMSTSAIDSSSNNNLRSSPILVSSVSTSNLSSISLMSNNNNCNSPNNNYRQQKPLNPFKLTLEQFSNLDFLLESMGLITLQSYIQTINLREFEKHLEKQPACYPFPLRPYDSVVKLVDLPNRYFDYLKEIVHPLEYCKHCKQLITRSCLICNQKLCLQTSCNNTIRSHMKTCPSQVLGLYLRFEDPGITMLAYNNAQYYKIYRSADGSSTSIIDTSFVLYKKGLKKIYKLWINSTIKKIGHK
ncbi:hypothetical protein PPL_08722 [Heterostelium album PN500]|uniref:E3 ubiquitin-protein ligase n=1 Tax=Heterostelium pallidum (strain ATCC 26659 / Pp 5 / PN500) TaxID=670386 RepID=D3BJJ5_HETP5|nr:hypothetical protein PPL_08722 [Heterostelium album PN500]EFA78075.1 hypothetical protein PPL_08722 [Heterostelium album PN500]|eukprot:XP_020430202.1 hypothetical protein PPL_08722 [Heterostelium album PN500]